MTDRTDHPGVISYRESHMPAFLSYLLTGALFMGAFLIAFAGTTT